MGKQRFLPQPSSIVEFEQTKWPQQPESHNDGQLIQLLHLSHVPRDWALIFSQSSISLFGLVFLLFFLISLFLSILRLCSVHIRKPALSNRPFLYAVNSLGSFSASQTQCNRAHFSQSSWIGVGTLFLFVFCLLSPLPGGWRHCVDGVIPSDTPASPAPSGHHWCIVGTAWWGQWLARTIKLGGLHKGHAHCMMGKCNGGSRCCHRGPRGGEREGEMADVSLPLSSCRSAEMLCLRLFEAGKRRQQPYLLLNKWSVWTQQDGQTFVLLHYGQVPLRWCWSLPLRFLKVSKIDPHFILFFLINRKVQSQSQMTYCLKRLRNIFCWLGSRDNNL